MNDSDIVLIRTSKIIEIGSLRKKLQPFKDHRKSEKSGDPWVCNENNQWKASKNVQKYSIQLFFCVNFSSKMDGTFLKSFKTIVFHTISDAQKIFDFGENVFFS